jgi:hypothetical protein
LAELELVKQQIKSLVKNLIGMLRFHLAKNDRNSIREIMIMVHLGVKMGFNLYISDVKAFWGVYIMQIILLRFIG